MASRSDAPATENPSASFSSSADVLAPREAVLWPSRPSLTAARAVGVVANRRHSTRSTCTRVVQLSIMHATSIFHSSAQRISSSKPNGDRTGPDRALASAFAFAAIVSSAPSARASRFSSFRLEADFFTLESRTVSYVDVSWNVSSGSYGKATRTGLLGAPKRAAKRRKRTGSVHISSSSSLGHRAARSTSAASSSPRSSGRARRTPEPPCDPPTVRFGVTRRRGGTTRPSARAPAGSRRAFSNAPAASKGASSNPSKSAADSTPKPPPPAAAAAARVASLGHPSRSSTSAGSSRRSPTGETYETRHGRDRALSQPLSAPELE
mmetsp:Transcript_13353/g.56894  ORF Transcript_13353/g.56894 Transcript_13353/m.56894 type:complete len:323 (-) Transcript_13353:1464-2432(-)